jgi:hypothetical protein
MLSSIRLSFSYKEEEKEIITSLSFFLSLLLEQISKKSMVDGGVGPNLGHIGFTFPMLFLASYIHFELSKASSCCTVSWRRLEAPFFFVMGFITLVAHAPLVAPNSDCFEVVECFQRNATHVLIGAFWMICTALSMLERNKKLCKKKRRNEYEFAIPFMTILTGLLLVLHMSTMLMSDDAYQQAETVLHIVAGVLLILYGLVRIITESYVSIRYEASLVLLLISIGLVWGFGAPMIRYPVVDHRLDGSALTFMALVVSVAYYILLTMVSVCCSPTRDDHLETIQTEALRAQYTVTVPEEEEEPSVTQKRKSEVRLMGILSHDTKKKKEDSTIATPAVAPSSSSPGREEMELVKEIAGDVTVVRNEDHKDQMDALTPPSRAVAATAVSIPQQEL